jgi:hypothetical protein
MFDSESSILKVNEYFNVLRDAIVPAHHVPATSGFLTHADQHPDGKKYHFRINASAPHFAFSLDVPNREPFGVLNPKKHGLTCRCDLIVFCFHKNQPVVFLVEVKGGADPGAAQRQIEAGAAFCRYLCELVVIANTPVAAPRTFGVAVYALRRPVMGLTKPKPICFTKQGRTNIPRTDWDLNTPLPLLSLLDAAMAS